MKVKLKTRLWLAWQAFQLKPVDRTPITPYRIANDVFPDWGCDNDRRRPKCKNPGKYCVSRTFVRIEISKDSDHCHLCEECTERLLVSQQEEEFL